MSCGGNCKCAGTTDDLKQDGMCPTPAGGVRLDDAGKCPCGKELKDCCHHRDDKSTENVPLEELCDPDMALCGVENNDEKTS